MTISQPTIDRLLKDQRGLCWNCGRDLQAGYHVHHAVYTRDVRFQKYLDQAENLIAVCPKCHSNHGHLSNLATRQKVWKHKVEMGYDMQKWHNEIPMKVKDTF